MSDRAILTPNARIAAFLIATLAIGAQLAQTLIDITEGLDLATSLWRQARYFTSLMVIATGVSFLLIALRNRWHSDAWMAAISVWIMMVGIIYHALLSATHNPTGIKAVLNEVQHTGVPILVVLIWAWMAPKAQLTYMQALWWVACPLGYAIYALIRGLFDGEFPYFFLNPETTSWLGVLAYLIGLGALFYLAGAFLVFISRALQR